jgi:hypothetical protein
MPKGRPKKTKETPLNKTKQDKVPLKKRGRPKKVTETPVIEAPIKKRGRPKKVDETPVEKVSNAPTQEEMELRKEKIRATIPKIDLYRNRELINITKDKDACREHTSFSCHRPDIYLDLGCFECSLKNACACPLFDPNRKPDDRVPKTRKFTSAKKSS